ncbi:hypothetical protein AOLI_G00126960 [Acnodon oligacanthus]
MDKIAAGAAAAIAGASLFGTSVEQISRSIDTWRNVTIEITNYSNKFTLTNPRTYTYSGYCYHPPQPTIGKMMKEACSFSKTPHTACGSVGVLTYQIISNEGKHAGELAIMFSVPYDYNQFENIARSPAGHFCHRETATRPQRQRPSIDMTLVWPCAPRQRSSIRHAISLDLHTAVAILKGIEPESLWTRVTVDSDRRLPVGSQDSTVDYQSERAIVQRHRRLCTTVDTKLPA